MSRKKIDESKIDSAEADAVSAEISEVGQSDEEEREHTIADDLDEIPVERLSEDEVAFLEQLNQQIEYPPIDEIHPSANKARKNKEAVPKVAKSIKELGFRSPIFVNGRTGEILTGHTRWAAAKKLGLTKVPVVKVFDLSPEKMKLLRLADNRVAEFSGWDFAELNREIEELKLELPDIELGDLGFGEHSDINIDDLFDPDKQRDKKPKEEEKETMTCPHCGKTFEV